MGQGGAKATIIDAAGAVLSYAFEEYPLPTPRPGWSEHDPHLYWQCACRMIHKAIGDANIRPGDIKGIAVSSALPSLVMVDRDHNPIHNAYSLMDKRAIDEVPWLKEILAKTRSSRSPRTGSTTTRPW